MTRRSDQLARIEAALARTEEALARHAVLLSEHSAATRTKLDALSSTVPGLAVREVIAARAHRGTIPRPAAGADTEQAIPGAGIPHPPAGPAQTAAGGGGDGEPSAAARRIPRKTPVPKDKM